MTEPGTEARAAPRVSVVIPCLDSAATIATQLAALARQEWSERWEVVVADNGSTDDTVQIVEGFRSQLPLTLVDAPDRKGAAHARNVGASAAAGRSLAFCDADDEVAPGWLQAVGEALKRHELVAARCDSRRLNAPWVRASREELAELPRLPFSPHLPFTGGGAIAIRRRLHEELGGFDERLLALEDTDYVIRAQLAGAQLYCARDAVLHYRYRDRLGEIYRQAWLYAHELALLQKRYADGPPPARWAWPLRGWATLLRALPAAWTKTGRARLAWVAGWQAGRLRGSARYRVLAV